MFFRGFVSAAAAVILGAATLALSAGGAGGATSPQGTECNTSQYSAPRDPANPLMLAQAPGSNPLVGARFFVDGPRHGAAAGAIARLLGMDPTQFPDSESWAEFDGRVVPAALKQHPDVATQVHALEKIAREPEVQRLSEFTGGGVPGAQTNEVNKIICGNMSADPGSIPVFQTFFLQPNGKYCAPKSAQKAWTGTFNREIDELAAAIGPRPIVLLLELDGTVTSQCVKGSAHKVYLQHFRYEVNKLSALPHAVVYVEGGYSDADSPRYTAKTLNAVGIGKTRGFFTNDTHLNWTIDEVHWAEKVSKKTHGAHFIVNTNQNGNGPLRPKNRHKNGNEVLCNPPGRALGPQPTTNTGFPLADAWMWTSVPGNSSGHCNGGPNGGVFWTDRGVQLALAANNRLGPSYPSQPY